ncbi:hypothetical protein [Bacillus thuringiensis]|uniref:hypothetical protein n=1 Tax=Bacillus thuringiensis TaxID=1428 RepID=UPI000BFE5080|nr:hypothetical protein [Bacillus thuringiensis]PGT89855.1 hypothetical protein COD17_08890 [Bacillus thuringiensis]
MKFFTQLAKVSRYIKGLDWYEKHGEAVPQDVKRELEDTSLTQAVKEAQAMTKPLGADVSIQVPVGVLSRLGREEKTITDFHKMTKSAEELAVNVMALPSDNSAKIQLTLNWNKYIVLTHQHGSKVEMTVYEETGTRHIVSQSFSADENLKTIYDWVEPFLRLDSTGQIQCKGCNKHVTKEEIGGSMFASHFCNDCWERTYKEQEANMNYN